MRLCRFTRKTSCYLSKTKLKSKCKHVPADGAHKTSASYGNVLPTGEVTGNILFYEIEVASLSNTWLVSGCEQKVFRVYFS